jgi:hypothetical protein
MKLFEVTRFGRKWLETDDLMRTRTPGRIEKLFCSLEGEERELFRRACANLPCPKEFMREHAATFGWDAGMVEKARIFTPRPLPQPVSYFPWSWHCYDNCLRLAREEGLLYVEGLVIGPGGPTIHAWNSTDGFNVIDRGWPCQHLNKYLGFIFDLQKHRDMIGKIGGLYEYANRPR